MTMQQRFDQFRSEARPTDLARHRVIERQMHVDALADLDREADREAPRREAEIKQLRATHSDLKRQARGASERLKDALVRDAAANVAYSQLRSMHEGALLETADAGITAFMVLMNVEREAALGASERSKNPAFAAINARIAAINDAVEHASEMLFRPDQADVGKELAMLRAGLPPADGAACIKGQGKRGSMPCDPAWPRRSRRGRSHASAAFY